ncbi:MAG: glutathione synthase, partial [Myxococcaceae bacterium]
LRKDPPADVHYQHVTRMLDMTGGDRRPLYLNEPSAIRTANEKLFALQFAELCPRTLVTSDPKSFRRFREEHGDVVVKPLDGFGGRGVFFVRRDDPNADALFEVTTHDGAEPAIVQEFLAASKQGDKRIVLLDGEPIGAILRVGSAFKCNLAAGGRPVRTELSAEDRAICARLGPTLREMGLLFVGIDVIGGKLTEVNVTSPTGVMEIDRADHVTLETEVIHFVERRCSAAEEGRGHHQREEVAVGVEQG